MEHRGQVKVSDHMLWLVQVPLPSDLIPPPTGIPGFVYFGNGGAITQTGVAGGTVDVTVVVLDEEPPVDASVWEDIDEGDLRTEEVGEVYIAGGYSFENIIPGNGRSLIPGAVAAHRVRVSASGRAAHYDEVADGEKYLIQMWPTSEPEAARKIQNLSGR
ncbi:hypothetical protein [Rhodococcus globerulus]|uniref:Uncharacterized protein n=1 Tax=Rhodococcus globerulus TaxID=33008 RepID=A0ABU4C2F4_RHOGO|nr:hypothetical protein [Rhodococcus globerulus]MDV6270662.1 hypothetical protein [Rhodococcus globerulus]